MAQTNRRKNLFWFIFLVTVVVYSVFVFQVFRVEGDDIDLALTSSRTSWWYRITYCWNNYSGRVAAKTFEYIFSRYSLWLWRIASLCSSVLISIYFYKFMLMFGYTESCLLAVTASLLPFLMFRKSFVEATLWISGSCNYLFVFMPGLVGSYYLYKDLFREKVKPVTRIFAAICLLIPVSSREQLGAIIIGLLAVRTAVIIVKEKHIPSFYLTLLLIYLLTFLLTSVFCPGVRLRTMDEVLRQQPDFYTVSLRLHIDYAYRWWVNACVNETGALLPVIALTELVLLVTGKKNFLNTVLLSILCMAFAFFAISGRCPSLTNFYAYWGKEDFSTYSYAILLFWSLVLLVILLAPLLLIKDRKIGVTVFLLIGAAYAAILMMVLSPTMYASGCRTRYMSSMVLILVAVSMVKRGTESALASVKCDISRKKVEFGIELALLVLECLKFGRILSCFADGFTPFVS